MERSDFNRLKAMRGEYAERKGEATCEKHGAYPVRVFSEGGEDVGQIGFCKRCSDDEQAEREREARLQRIRNEMESARIPKRFMDCEIAGYRIEDENRRQFKLVEDYAARWPEQCRTGESLLLLGNVGTGKTHLAVGILKAAIRVGIRGRYCTVAELVREIRSTWRGHGDFSERQIIEHFGSVGLLVLDEVGVQYGSDSERVILFDVLNERYERMLPTIVAGNVTVEELSRCLDERSVDRLRENGGKVALFTGKSQRRAAA